MHLYAINRNIHEYLNLAEIQKSYELRLIDIFTKIYQLRILKQWILTIDSKDTISKKNLT